MNLPEVYFDYCKPALSSVFRELRVNERGSVRVPLEWCEGSAERGDCLREDLERTPKPPYLGSLREKRTIELAPVS